MTPKNIRERVLQLEHMDDETAHSREDTIHQDVLKYIAENSTDIKSRNLAKTALESLKLPFSRWYA